MRPEIEQTIERLTKKSFKPDPLVGTHYSRIVSVMSSAYKRHGFILEKAILTQLRKCTRFEVWHDTEFQVCENADLLVNNKIKNPAAIIGNRVNYEQGPRTLQVDIIVFDKINKTLRAYEVKRGFGVHDAGKKRSILRDILCLNLLLKSYGEQKGYDIRSAEAKAIFYYGKRSISKELSLTGPQLDDHFKWQVYAAVEQVNAFFQQKLYEFCAQQGPTEDVWPTGEADPQVLGMNVSQPFGLGELNKNYADLTEDEVLDLLNNEISGQRRLMIATRLHQRYTALRAARERDEILKELMQKVPYYLRADAQGNAD
jgi:hypothetical protein